MGLKTSPCFTPHVETKSLLIKVSTDTSFELDFTMGVLIHRMYHFENSRIFKFLNLNKIIHENQIGFKEESRNTDHIFTLKSIIEIYESQKKKVFAAFIDLRKLESHT
jgi:hypothetical protein